MRNSIYKQEKRKSKGGRRKEGLSFKRLFQLPSNGEANAWSQITAVVAILELVLNAWLPSALVFRVEEH